MQTQNMIRYALLVVFVFLLTVLQTTILRAVEIFGVIPNLLFSAVVCYSLTKGDWKALVFGIVCGMILDFFGGRAVGMNTLLCMYTALVCILLHGGLFNNNAFVAMIFVFLLSIAYEFFIYFFSLLIWGQTDILYALLFKILPGSVYTALVTLFIYPFARALANQWVPRRHSRR